MFKKKEKIEYITLEEMRREGRGGVIVLENRYFRIEKISLEGIKELDEREKDIEIESVLDERIEEYNPIDYIEKEIILKKDSEDEEIVIFLLNRDIVDKILEEAKEKKIKIVGIIPYFFLRALELKNNSNKDEKFIDVDSGSTIIIDFKKGKIEDISVVEIEREKILESEIEDILKYIFEMELENLNILSFYEKDREIMEMFEDIDNLSIEINDWSNNIEYNYGYDFLPIEYLNNLKKNNFIKKGIIIFFIIFIFQISIGFIFQYFCKLKSEKIEYLEKDLVKYQDDIDILKENILKIEESEKIREEELEKIKFKNLKLGVILNKIESYKPKGLNILNLELSEKNRLKIIGESINEEKILKFQEKILKDSKFKNLNHDYIKKDGEIYNFQIETEVYL